MQTCASRLSPILAVLAACAGGPDAADDSTGGDAETQDGTDANDETDTNDEAESGSDEGAPTCAEEACAGSSESYCFPCAPDSDQPEPFLTLGGASGFADGGTMKVVCGGQGSWMFEIRPQFGGFTLDAASVAFDYEVRVQDFDIDGGPFAAGTRSIPMLCCDTTQPYDYESGLYGCNEAYLGSCYSYSGGLRVIRFFPPDTIPELTDLNGKAVEIDITMFAGDTGPQAFHFEGTVAATQSWEDCGYYDALPDPAHEDPFDWSAGRRIPS